MLTDDFYKNLFTKPIELTEDEAMAVARAIRESYRKERRKTIAEAVKDVMLKCGKPSITSKDKALLRICYFALKHRGVTKDDHKITEKEIKECIFKSLVNSPLFYSVSADERDGRLVKYCLRDNNKEK